MYNYIFKNTPMKNTLSFITLLFLIIIFAGCNENSQTNIIDNTPANEKVTQQNEQININTNKPSSLNILLIIADDMGLDASPWYSEYKGQKPHTPTLDALAEKGLVFDNVWANPLCSPTRSTILTGKYGVHTGVLGALSKKDEGVSTSEHSLQKLITEKAPTPYDQAVIGKWHLATDKNGGDDNPKLMGVPHYSGYISGAMKDYYRWKKVTNGVSSTSTTYATTDFTNDAISWVNEDNSKPWFLWLAYTAPHTPFHMPPEDLLSDETKNGLSGDDIEENPLPYYLAAIEAMDTEIARFLEKLPQEQRGNTVIIFIGDNGTPGQVTQAPFQKRESKGSISRGGIHVPMLVSGAGVNPGRIEDFINSSDLYTTIAELTGISLPQYGNSISFAPLLFGEKRQKTRDYLYAEVASPNKDGEPSHKNGWTVRANGYQYISLDNETEKLFADSDLGQENDLIKKSPKIASELRELGLSIRGNKPMENIGQFPTNDEDVVCTDILETIISDNAVTFNIPDTGQSKCYNNTDEITCPAVGSDFYGQDAQYTNNSPDYTDNNDDTITDNVTGLVWQKNMGEKMTFEKAFSKAEKLNLGGHDDWRVPTIKELYSLILFSGQVGGQEAIDPFIDMNYFDQPLGDTSKGEREIDAQTWSSTEYVGQTMKSDATIFGVNFVDGRIKGYPKYNPRSKEANEMYFRFVRGNPNYEKNNFVDNKDETITDQATGLMWMKSDSEEGKDWENALNYCENLNFANHSDWKLPNAKELQSIVDYTRSPQTTNSAAIDPIFNISSIIDPEGKKNYPFFWTSNTHLDGKDPESGAVYISFGDAQGKMNETLMDVHGAGAQRSDPKSGNKEDYPKYHGPQGDVQYVYNYVRCVR